MLAKTTQPSSIQRLTKLYVLSLGVLAGLSIVAQVIVQHQLKQQEENLQVIGEASHHQIMNQQLSKAALAVKLAPDAAQRRQRLEELHQIVTTWEAPSKSLKHNMMAVVPEPDKIRLGRVFTTLELRFQTMIGAAKEILVEHQNPINPAVALQDSQKNRLAIARILSTEYAFSQAMEQVTNLYNQQVTQGISHLQKLEFGLLGITLTVLLLEGLLVFRPAVDKLRQTLERLTLEQEKSERLLLNILPEPIADRLKQEPGAIADGFSDVTVLFADIVGFTELSGRMPPAQVVELLNQIFSSFDALAEKHGLEKIKTIGDAYMAVGGLPHPRPDHAIAVAQMALEMQDEILSISQALGEAFEMRIGINSGAVVAGVIGTKKFIYDLWGDTVNIASRMESHGQPGMIQVSETTFHAIQDQFSLEERGTIQIKGKGEMRTYWLKGLRQTPSESAIALISE